MFCWTNKKNKEKKGSIRVVLVLAPFVTSQGVDLQNCVVSHMLGASKQAKKTVIRHCRLNLFETLAKSLQYQVYALLEDERRSPAESEPALS